MSDKPFSLFRIILALYLDKTMQASVCRNHSLRLFVVALSACTLLSACGEWFALTSFLIFLFISCRTSSLLQGKRLMLFSSVTLIAMDTGRNMQTWRGKTATSTKQKRYA